MANDVQCIKYPLEDELKLARRKRVRCYGTMIHFVYLGTQLWEHDLIALHSTVSIACLGSIGNFLYVPLKPLFAGLIFRRSVLFDQGMQ
jgi:hypothetical protein